MDGDGVFDFARKREDWTDGNLGDLPKALDEIGIGRIADRDRQYAIEHVQADGFDLLGNFDGNFLERLIGDDGGEGIHIGDLQRVGPVATRIVFTEILGVDHRLNEGTAFEARSEVVQLLRVIEIRQVSDAIDEGVIFWV